MSVTRMNNKKLLHTIALVIALALFIVLYKLVFPTKLILSIALSLLSLIITRRLLKILFLSKKNKPTNKKMSNNELVDTALEKLRSVRNMTLKIQNNNVATKIHKICSIGFDILNDVKKNPEDIRKIKQFINYYIETTEKIVKNYIELSQKKEASPEIETTLKRVEEVLDSIKETYEKQLANLIQDDLFDLNTEITVLEKIIKFET